MDSGYSGTPLTRKLGLKPGMTALFIEAPDDYLNMLELHGVQVLRQAQPGLHFAQVFATQRAALDAELKRLLPLLARDGTIWVSWPKQAVARKLGIATDINEDAVRDVALPMGLVDVKVCAVDETWSGLKLVIRKELR